ncbi:MAG: hypothetical protein ACRDQZ_05230 [Mycobacteriales bacterium]
MIVKWGSPLKFHGDPDILVNSAERLLLDDEFRDKARKVVKKADASWVDKLPATGADWPGPLQRCHPRPRDFVVASLSRASSQVFLTSFGVR